MFNRRSDFSLTLPRGVRNLSAFSFYCLHPFSVSQWKSSPQEAVGDGAMGEYRYWSQVVQVHGATMCTISTAQTLFLHLPNEGVSDL